MPETVSTRYLAALAAHGVESLFVNAGTDFAPIVEAYATHREEGGPALPTPVVCTHENLAAGMAHGAAMVTGRPQALMLHVSVGTANAICATINAARDGVPLLVTAGRSPILETGAVGVRDLPIHWGQELFDQAGMLREVVKWDYELRDARQVDAVVERALSVATAQPSGPVYLSLPREVLGVPAEPAGRSVTTTAPTAAHPDPAAVEALADRLAAAEFPLIVAMASGTDQDSVALLSEVASRYAIGVSEGGARYLNIPNDHPYRVGADRDLPAMLARADVVVFLECDVPWVPSRMAPRDGAFLAHVGVDPLFSTYAMRSHRADLNITAGPTPFLAQLLSALEARADRIPAARHEEIRSAAASTRQVTETMRERDAALDDDAPITKITISTALGELLGEDDMVFNEYISVPDLLHRTKPGTYYYLPASGGLGWGLPAALGAKYAAPDRTVVATLGDGAYLFANPAACHHAAAKHNLPVLTVLANNSIWNAVDNATRLVYPHGRAMALAEDRFSNLSPSPDFAAYCTASGGHGVTVTRRSELRGALEEALYVVRDQKRQALLDIRCA